MRVTARALGPASRARNTSTSSADPRRAAGTAVLAGRSGHYWRVVGRRGRCEHPRGASRIIRTSVTMHCSRCGVAGLALRRRASRAICRPLAPRMTASLTLSLRFPPCRRSRSSPSGAALPSARAPRIEQAATTSSPPFAPAECGPSSFAPPGIAAHSPSRDGVPHLRAARPDPLGRVLSCDERSRRRIPARCLEAIAARRRFRDPSTCDCPRSQRAPYLSCST